MERFKESGIPFKYQVMTIFGQSAVCAECPSISAILARAVLADTIPIPSDVITHYFGLPQALLYASNVRMVNGWMAVRNARDLVARYEGEGCEGTQPNSVDLERVGHQMALKMLSFLGGTDTLPEYKCGMESGVALPIGS